MLATMILTFPLTMTIALVLVMLGMASCAFLLHDVRMERKEIEARRKSYALDVAMIDSEISTLNLRKGAK